MILFVNGVTIQDFLVRCKNLLEEGIGQWGLIVMVFLTSAGSFCLGRLSALEDARPPVSIREAPIDQKLLAIPLGGQFVGSRTGGVYYYPWCAGAQKIPDASQVWFSSEEAAQKAGYQAAKNCKGLAGQ